MKKTTTPKQFEILVKYLQTYGDMAISFANSSEAKTRRRQMWMRLAEELNHYGPPVRNCVEWKSIWSDYKYNLKRKLAADLKLEKRRNSNKRLSFNRTEQIVISVLGIREKLDTSNKRDRKVVQQSPETVPDLLIDNSSMQYNSTGSDVEIEDNKEGIANVICNDFDSITTAAPVSDYVEPVPNEQPYIETADCDANVSMVLKDSLMMMQTTQQAILKELKESNRYKKNSYELKKRLLQLEQEKLDAKKLQNNEDNKQAYINIELKRKELELYEMKLKGQCTQCLVKRETN